MTSTYCGEGTRSPDEARAGGAYVDGNLVRSEFNDPLVTSTDLLKTQIQPFPTAPTSTLSAEDAACQILADGALRTLDSHDQNVMEELGREVAKFVDCR